MRLILKNIRQHLDRTIDLPDMGIVKLSGKSGVGKTTVLDAIRHVLLGDVDDMVNWDQDHASITLQWKGVEVKRTMRPNSLTFVDETGKIHKDDVAQEEIYRWIAMNNEEFLASSLIEQGMPSSLLNFKPAEQLRFIQRLAFGDEDPEITKKRIWGLITDRKTRLSIAESAELTLNDKVKAAAERVAFLESTAPQSVSECKTPEEIKAIEKKLSAANDSIRQCNKDLRDLRASLDNPVFAEMANLADRKRQHAEQVATLNQQIAAHHGELVKLAPQEPEAERNARMEARAAIKDGLEYLKILDEAKAASAEIKAKFELEGSPLEGLKTKLRALMEENAAISSEQATLVNELQRLRETPASQPCPECQAALKIVGGKIVKHSHPAEDLEGQIIRLEQDIEAQSLAKRKNQRARDAVTAAVSQLEALKGKLTARQKPTFTTPAEAEQELGRLDDEMQAAKIRENTRGSLVTKIDTLGKMLESTVTKHQLYVSSLNERHSKAEPLEKVKEKISKVEAQLASAQDEVFDLTGILNAERENARLMYEVRAHNDRLEAAREAYGTAEVQRDDAQAAAAQARARLAAALRLKELSDKAAMEAVDQIMAGINVNSKHYIDSMFPDDGTVVQLLNKKTLSDGEERAKSSLKVTHKGSNPKGISGFSGGEKMRLALGFQLGLADMYHSPLLMIDEALAWLDLEAKERCLETIRPLALNKLILVVEHGLPDSLVDHVVSL